MPRPHRRAVVPAVLLTAALACAAVALAFGAFAPKVDYAVDQTPSDLAVADLDRDGRKDLVVPDSTSTGSASVLLGKANGSFEAGEDAIVPGGGINEVATADFDGDGRRDLALTLPQFDEVAVLGGRGDGTFKEPRRSSLGDDLGGAPAIAASDLNRDGNPDLAVATTADAGDDVVVLRGRGDRTFKAPVPYGVGDNPTDIAIARLDGDRRRDLAVTNSTSADVAILRGKADGTFAAAFFYTADVGAPNASPQGIEAADLDGDDDRDLAIANGFAGVTVLEGNGNATFGTPEDFQVGSFPRFLTVAQLTDDRKRDIAAANQDSDDISVLVNLGGGDFDEHEDYDTLDRPWAIEAADLKRDGGKDLAVVNEGADQVSVFLNQP